MSDYEFVLSSGKAIPVIVTTRRGLRNITLRPKTQPVYEIHISKPWLTPVSVALRFLEQKRNWCERIFMRIPEKKHIFNEDVIEFLGKKVLIKHDSTFRANKFVECEDGSCALIVGGEIDMLERRVRDFIKAEFLVYIKRIIKTTPKEFWPVRVTIRDTSSRWGSCSTSGTMSFSWRLAFAPVDVIRYVVMHELAHKKHMDHSSDFWKQVADLYGFGVERAKRWLNQHGSELYQYF